jgi:hypothetical protein
VLSHARRTIPERKLATQRFWRRTLKPVSITGIRTIMESGPFTKSRPGKYARNLLALEVLVRSRPGRSPVYGRLLATFTHLGPGGRLSCDTRWLGQRSRTPLTYARLTLPTAYTIELSEWPENQPRLAGHLLVPAGVPSGASDGHDAIGWSSM